MTSNAFYGNQPLVGIPMNSASNKSLQEEHPSTVMQMDRLEERTYTIELAILAVSITVIVVFFLVLRLTMRN
jgi:hypothetical protein